MLYHALTKELFKIAIQNLPLYGYGIKGLMLSMVMTALRVSNNTLNVTILEKTLAMVKELLENK